MNILIKILKCELTINITNCVSFSKPSSSIVSQETAGCVGQLGSNLHTHTHAHTNLDTHMHTAHIQKATSSSKRFLISCELLMFLQQPGTLVPVILVCTLCICAYTHILQIGLDICVCHGQYVKPLRCCIQSGFTVYQEKGHFAVKQPFDTLWL